MGEKGLRAVRRRNSGNPVVSGAGGLCLLFLVSLLRFRFLPFLPSCSILSSLPPSLHRASSLPPPSLPVPGPWIWEAGGGNGQGPLHQQQQPLAERLLAPVAPNSPVQTP